MNKLLGIIQTVFSFIPKTKQTQFLTWIGKKAGVKVSTIEDAMIALGKMSYDTAKEAAKYIAPAFLVDYIEDLASDSPKPETIKQIASAESAVKSSTDLTNALKRFLSGASATSEPIDVEFVARTLNAKTADADGRGELTIDDLAAKSFAMQEAFRAGESLRKYEVMTNVANVRTMEYEVDRVGGLLGLSRKQVIELAQLLRKIDGSYEGLL